MKNIYCIVVVGTLIILLISRPVRLSGTALLLTGRAWTIPHFRRPHFPTNLGVQYILEIASIPVKTQFRII